MPISWSVELELINLDAEEPEIDELMVEIAMFSGGDVRAMKLALTVCLSKPADLLLQRRKRLIGVRQRAHEAGARDFRDMWCEHAVKTRLSSRRRLCAHTDSPSRDEIKSLGASYFY